MACESQLSFAQTFVTFVFWNYKFSCCKLDNGSPVYLLTIDANWNIENFLFPRDQREVSVCKNTNFVLQPMQSSTTHPF